MRRHDQPWYRGNSPYTWVCRSLYGPPFNMQPLPPYDNFMQFSGPEHRFVDPRMPYQSPNPPHRGLLSSSGPRRGSLSWQEPFQRNHPPRRRHHLDDIFLPNHDDEEYPEQGEGFHSRPSNYRPPIRIDVRTTSPETITKAKAASTLKTHEKPGDPAFSERIVSSADPRVKIKDNVEGRKQSEVNTSSVKDCVTRPKSWTVTDNTRANEDKNITIQKTEIICKEPEKRCETKTNQLKIGSLPKVNEISKKEPIQKTEIIGKEPEKRCETKTNQPKIGSLPKVNEISEKEPIQKTEIIGKEPEKRCETKTNQPKIGSLPKVNEIGKNEPIQKTEIICKEPEKRCETKTNQPKIGSLPKVNEIGKNEPIQKTEIIGKEPEKRCETKTNQPKIGSLPKVNEISKNEPIQKTKIIGKEPEKRCETKTNQPKIGSLPKVNEIGKNEPIQKTEIIGKEPEKRCETKTNQPKIGSLPKVNEIGNKEPISKDETSTDKKVILHRSNSTTNKEKSPRINTKAKDAIQSEIKVNNVNNGMVNHGNNAKNNEYLGGKNALKKQESIKEDSHSTNTETKVPSKEIKTGAARQVKSQSKDVAVPEIITHVDSEDIFKSASTRKKDTSVYLKDKSSKPIRRDSFKSKINKVTDENCQNISDSSSGPSKKSTTNTTVKINDVVNKDKDMLPNRKCATGSVTKIVEQRSNCTNDKNDESHKIVQTINDNKSDDSGEKRREKLLENKSLNIVKSTTEKIDSDAEIDIVKELEALVSNPNTQASTANTTCKEQPTKASNHVFVNSAKATKKMTEENLTQDNPTSLPSSPQAIKKDITIKLIRSPLPKGPLTPDKHSSLQKSPLTTDLSPLSKSPLTTGKELSRKSVSNALSLGTTNLAHPKSADNSAVSKKRTASLPANSNLKKRDFNSGVSTGSINTYKDADKNPPILEDIFILEDALKNIDKAPEIIEIPCSPPSQDGKIKSKDNVKDDIIDICSTPKRKANDLDDVQIIEEKCDTIEIIDNDSVTIIKDDYKKPTTPINVIKIESPDDCERFSSSSVEKSREQNRPVEDFRNLDTRGSFLWTFHQRFDDPRIVDMDISQSPPPNFTAEPVRSDEQMETDRCIHNMEVLWKEISDNTNSKTLKNIELLNTKSNKVNQKVPQVDTNANTCQLNQSDSSTLKSNKSGTTLARQDSVYNVQDNLSEKLLPFSKKVKIADKTAESPNTLPTVSKITLVNSRNGYKHQLRRSSFSHNSNVNSYKTPLRKSKSLDDIVFAGKIHFSSPKAPVDKLITENFKSVTNKEICVENTANISRVIIVSEKLESNLGIKTSIQHFKSTAFVDYKDELLSLLSSSGYQDQIDDEVNVFNKDTPDVEKISKQLDLTSNSVSNKSIIADSIDSSVQKKRKRVRRIESSDEESTDLTPRLIEDQPKQKKQKIKDKSARKRKISLDDKNKNKEARKGVEVHNASPINEITREKPLTKAKLTSLSKTIVNHSAPEIISTSPTKYVTKAEYVKTFAQKKALVPNISLSIDPIPKIQKITKRRATFTCEADNEKILRKVVSGARCKQKFLDLFGSISDDEEELIQVPSKEVCNPSIKDKQNSKTQIDLKAKTLSDKGKPKKNKIIDKKRKRLYTSKPFIEENDSSDNDTSKSSKQSKKLRTSSKEDEDNCKRIKDHESSIKSKEKSIDEKEMPQSKDKNFKTESCDKSKTQKVNGNSETNVYKDTRNKSSLESRRTSSSSSDSKSTEYHKDDKKRKHKENINLRKDERKSRSQSKESDSSSNSVVEKRQRKSISKERKNVDVSERREKNGGVLKQKNKELMKHSSKDVDLNVQVSVTECNQKNVTKPIHKDIQNSGLSDNKQSPKKIKIIQEIKLRTKDTKGCADPIKRLKESCRRNSAPDLLSSSSESSLIIGEIKDLPLLCRASEGEVNSMFQNCQEYTPPAIKYNKITNLLTVDMECTDKVHISEPIKTHCDATTVKQKDDDDDVIEIRPNIPVIDLTVENIRTNQEQNPKDTLNDLLLEAKKEIEELVQDQGTITLYRSEEADGNDQDEDVQAVAASISLVAGETNSHKIKNHEKLPISLSEGSLQCSDKNVSNNKTLSSLDETPNEKSDSTKETSEKTSPAASELFSQLVQNLEITNTSHTDNTDFENPHPSSNTETLQPPVLGVSVSVNVENQETSQSLQEEHPEVSMSLEDENQRAISSILDILQNNQCVRVNTDSRDDLQICTDQNSRKSPSVLGASALHENTINKNSITNRNHIETISTKNSSVHPADSGKTTEQVNHTEKQGSQNTAECQTTGVTSEPQESNKTATSNVELLKIVGPSRSEKTNGQGCLEARLSVVQSQIVQEDSFGQHRGLPQTLREYRPTQRTKVTSTFVPPALININSTQRSPRKDQMTQTRIAGVQPTQTANPENQLELDNHNNCRDAENQVIDLTEDNGELCKTDKKLIIDIFTRHTFFLAQLCMAQNNYIQYLRHQTFCQNYFKAEIALFEEQKQARLLSQSLRLITELQNLNIRATKKLGETAFEIVEQIIQQLLKKAQANQVTRSMVYLLIAQLIKPQADLFTRIPLLKSLIRICNMVVGKLLSKVPGIMTEEQKRTFTYQVKEYNRLFGNPALRGNQLPASPANGQSNNNFTTDISQSRNPAEYMRQNNSITEPAKLNARPNSQSRNLHQPPATANTLQSSPIIMLEQQFGPPRPSLLNSGGSLSLNTTLSRELPNVTIRQDITEQTERLTGSNPFPIGSNSMNPPNFNVSMMRQHRFATPRHPSSFVMPNSSHQSRSLVKPVQDLPGGANTNTLGCTPRYIPNYDIPNQSHVYSSLPRRQSNAQIVDFTQSNPVNSSPPPLSISNSQFMRGTHLSQNDKNPLGNSPMLSRLLSDGNCANQVNTSPTLSSTQQQHPLPQCSQLNNPEPSLMSVISNRQSNIPQSPRHIIPQSPRPNVRLQSPRHNQHNLHKNSSRQPPSYDESIAAKSSSLSGSILSEELKKRSENLLNELLFTPDSEPLFATPVSPRNENFRIKLPFTQPDTIHSSTVHNTSANTVSTIPLTSSQSVILNNPITASSQFNVQSPRIDSPHFQSTTYKSLSPVTFSDGRSKEAVVLNQGLAALSSIGPASAMLNSSPQQIQNIQPDTNIQNSDYQSLSTSNQTLVEGNNANQRKSTVVIINDSATTPQPQNKVPVVVYHQIPTLPQYQPSSIPETLALENSNQSEALKNIRFRVMSQASDQLKSKECKPKPKPKRKPKPKKKAVQTKRKKGSSSKIIETVDLLSSSDDESDMTSETHSDKESESERIKRAEAQFQVEVSEITNACIKSGRSVNQTVDTAQLNTTQATIIAAVPESTSITHNQVETVDMAQCSKTLASVKATSVTHNEVQSVDTTQLGMTQATIVDEVPTTQNQVPEPQSKRIQPLSTSDQISQPSTSSGVNRRDSINNDETIQTIDLTWIDDLDDQELQREMDFIFIKKEEPRDEDDQLQDPNNVVPSPADSGVSSPPNQGEDDTTVYTVEVQRLCICAATAEYNCVCGEAWYCGQACQIKDWESHQKVCHITQKTVDAEEEMMLNEHVQMTDKT